MQENKETKSTTSEVKAEVKEVAKAVEKAAADVAKTVAPKKKGRPGRPAGKKNAPKDAAKKSAAGKKQPAEVRMVLQYQNNDTDAATIEEKVKAQFVAEGHRAGAIKKLDIYVKPEEYAAYYVINEKFSGRVDLF